MLICMNNNHCSILAFKSIDDFIEAKENNNIDENSQSS